MTEIKNIISCRDLSQALTSLKEYEEKQKDLRILAGGTDVMVGLRAGVIKEQELLNIYGIEELKGITFDGENLHIGALTTHDAIVNNELVLHYIPALSDACSHVGSQQIRNRGTIGGNICNASPAADSVPVLAAAGAFVKYQWLEEELQSRILPVEEFLLGVRKTALPKNALLTEVIIPVKDRDRIVFEKVGGRTSLAIAVVSLALGEQDGGYTAYFGSMAAKIVRCERLEKYLDACHNGSRENAGKDVSIQEIAAILKEELQPITDVRATAEYRILAAAGIVLSAWERLRNR